MKATIKVLITATILFTILLAGISNTVDATDGDSESTDVPEIDVEYWSEIKHLTFNKTEYSYQTSFRAAVHDDSGNEYSKSDMLYLDVVICEGKVVADSNTGDQKDLVLLYLANKYQKPLFDVVNIVISENMKIDLTDEKIINKKVDINNPPYNQWGGVNSVYRDVVPFDLVITKDGKATYLPNLQSDFILLKYDLSQFELNIEDIKFDWNEHTAYDAIKSINFDKKPNNMSKKTYDDILNLLEKERVTLDMTSEKQKNAGEYTINVSVKENKYFYGEWNGVTWKIVPRDIRSPEIVVMVVNPEYTGEPVVPTIIVIDYLNGEHILNESDKSYTQPDYDSIIEPQIDVKDPKYIVPIIGKNNFDKERMEVWSPTPLEITKIVIKPKEFTYNGDIQGPTTIKVYSGSTKLTEGTDYTLDGVFEAINADTYKIKATAAENSNYQGSKTGTWKIVAVDWTSSIEPSSFEYSGSEQAPEVTITTANGEEYKLQGVSTTKGVPFELGGTFIAVNPSDDYKLTVKPISNNYVEKIDSHLWAINVKPVQLNGVLHVNHIEYTGLINASSFDGKIFLMQGATYNPDTYGNEILFDGYGIALPSDAYFITVKDGWGQLVFTDSDIEEENIKAYEAQYNTEVKRTGGTTSSEWNWIRIDGNIEKGYTGSVVGHFYVNFDVSETPKSYEIGESFIDSSIKYTVTSLDNKTVSVTGYEEGIASSLVIPDYVNGFKVTKIADKAFYGCKTITSLQLGDYVTSIGVKAFTNCTKLKSVEFEDSLKTISAYAFYGCSKLTDVDMDDSVKTIGKYAFYKCTALKSIVISSGLKTLGGNAFSVSFIDADGKGITQTAKNLAGHTFEGSNKVLKLVA